jgi:tRNA-specific 2-thiouridylase
MSGGVDSSVAAALLAEQGYDVVGITMRVVADEEHQASVFQPCCSVAMTKDARQVADTLGFPHYTLNLVTNFQSQVIDDFTSEYFQGRTPNPCVRCNQRLKFGTLYKKAVELEAEYIATGHYVRLARIGERFSVQRAVYTPKDQSYVMAGLSQRQLAKGLFPLGGMTKEETREKARAFGFASAETPESQDICFVPDNDYKGFLERRVGAMAPGPIFSVEGDRLGVHTGLTNYTVGQRKGLGIAAPRPLYVVRIDMEHNALIVGHEEKTLCREFTAAEVVWGGLAPQAEPFRGRAQIRYHHFSVPCTITPDGNKLHIEFDEPERSVTPGQWAVIYDKQDRVLVSGNIDAYETHRPAAKTARAVQA